MIAAPGSSAHNHGAQTAHLVLKSAPKPYYSVSTPTTTLVPGTALLPSIPLCQIPIFSDDDPATTVPKRCWQCLQLVREPVVCGRCKEEWYCSRDCKEIAWEAYHSVICKALPSVYYSIKTTGFTSPQAHACLLLLKLLASSFRDVKATDRLKLYTPMNVEETRSGSSIIVIDPSNIPTSLEIFFHLIPRPLKETDQKIIRVLLEKYRFISQSGLDERHLGFLLERFQGNNHVLSDERLKPIGHAILPEISRHCNHSCTPAGVVTSVWEEEDKVIKVMIKLIKPVKPDESVTIPYLDPILPLHDRQTFLEERYGFTCDCPLCAFQGSLPPAVLAQSDPSPHKLTDMFERYVKTHMDTLRGETPYAPWTEFMPGHPLPNRSTPYLPSRVQMKAVPHDTLACLKPDVVRELTSLFVEGVDAQEWDLARETGEHVLVVYGLVYGWRHPLVGLHLLALAKVRINQFKTTDPVSGKQTLDTLEKLSAAIQDASIYTVFARECLETSTSMRGPRSVLSTQSVGEELEEVERECREGWDVLGALSGRGIAQ